VLLGAGVLIGLVLLARRGEWSIVLYVACSLGLFELLPWPGQTARYLVPLAPFLTISLTRSLIDLARVSRALRVSVASLCALLLLGQAFAQRQTFAAYHWPVRFPSASGSGIQGSIFLFEDKDEWRAFYAALGWLSENSDPSAIVASSCPHLVWLHAGRKSVMPPFEPSVDEAQRLLDTVPVDFVIVDDMRFVDVSRRYAEPVMTAHPETWEPVYHASLGQLTIYKRR
jgi:hypothetical protein